MHYHIRGKLLASDLLRLPHEEFVHLIQSKVVPSLRALRLDSPHGKVLAGGLPAGGQDVIMIVDLKNAESHGAVRPIPPFLAHAALLRVGSHSARDVRGIGKSHAMTGTCRLFCLWGA